MPLYIRVFQVLVGLAMSLIGGVAPCIANDVPLPYYALPVYKELMGTLSANLYIIVGLFVTNFVATVFIEYLVVIWLMGDSNRARLELFLWVLVVNAITNPASQIGTLFLTAEAPTRGSEALAWSMICAVQFAAITVEFGLLRWIFGRMHRRGKLDKPVTAARTIMIVFAANLVSFVFGWVTQYKWMY